MSENNNGITTVAAGTGYLKIKNPGNDQGYYIFFE
jgi:hypothetical protein